MIIITIINTYDNRRRWTLIIVHALLCTYLALLYSLLEAIAERLEAGLGKDLVLHERANEIENSNIIDPIEPLSDCCAFTNVNENERMNVTIKKGGHTDSKLNDLLPALINRGWA